MKHIGNIIDEISMVRADLLDAMDVSLRKSRNSDAIGGVQMVLSEICSTFPYYDG